MNCMWAPWRSHYITNVDQKDEGCIFCTKPRQNDDRDNLILYRGMYNFIIMNKFPYNNGHCMIVPYLHSSDSESITGAPAQELWSLMNKTKEFLFKLMHPEGFNIGMNIGRIAGAGIDQHLHLHIVPRWNGDTNFMPVIADMKIISQSIFETYDLLTSLFTNYKENG